MEQQVRNFKELKVWKAGIEIALKTYELTRKFPKHEVYGLGSQMQRCSISIPSNIAEGQQRKTSKEFSHFLRISLGSLAELQTQLLISKELNYITIEDMDKLEPELEQERKMPFLLIHSLKIENN